MPGQVRFRGSQILLNSGLIAMDADCCCCDLFATTLYDAPNTRVIASASSTSGATLYTFRVHKNGTLVREVIGTFAAQTWTVNVVNGDEVTVSATAVNFDCVVGSTCIIADEPTQPACTYFSPSGLSSGQCLDASQLLAAYLPNTNRTATISGLSGNMSALNGAYTVGCGSATAGATVNWTGGGYAFNYGLVSVQWLSEASYKAEIRCVQSQIDACVLGGAICNPSDATRRTGSKISESVGIGAFWPYSFRRATCGDCVAAPSKFYESGASLFSNSTSNGSPAESGSIAWS